MNQRACQRCGEPIPDDRGTNARYCSVYCQQHRHSNRPRAERHGRICLNCGGPIAPDRLATAKFCCRACKSDFRANRDKRARFAMKSENRRGCAVCGGPLPPDARLDRRYCSDLCVRRARRHSGNSTRRLQVGDLPEAIPRISIYERDEWVCQLCGKPVDPTVDYPDPMSASIDHVVPLSRGGRHVSSNLQLAHLVCNVTVRDFKPDQTPRPPIVLGGREYYRIPEAAEALGVSYAVLDAAIRNGRLDAYRAGRYRYIPAPVLAGLLATGFLTGRQARSHSARAARDARRSIPCRECGDQFVPSADRRKYCSPECAEAGLKRRQRSATAREAVPVACVVCGAAFIRKTGRQLTCSPECSRTHRADRARERKPPQSRSCKVCGKPVPPPAGEGHPRATCSEECRTEWPRLRARRHYYDKVAKKPDPRGGWGNSEGGAGALE